MFKSVLGGVEVGGECISIYTRTYIHTYTRRELTELREVIYARKDRLHYIIRRHIRE